MKRVCLLILAASLCVILTGRASTPPGVATIEEHFQDNYEDIRTVVEFMIASPYSEIYIDSAKGTMDADFETVDIADQNVTAAVNRLFKKGLIGNGAYYFVSKSGNTIYFLEWSGIYDAGCGVAYSINGTDLPNILYCTELIPLSKAGWYYYVDDYNEWRVGKRPQIED